MVNGLINQFSLAYFVALAPLVFLQLKTLSTLFKLNDRLLKPLSDDVVGSAAVPVSVGRQS